jgi:hypothetical protein
MPSPTGRQIEYLRALGVVLSGDATREEASRLISEAHRGLDGPPTRLQLKLADRWGVKVPEAATRAELTDLLVALSTARHWVFSVYRHLNGGNWRRYEDCDLPDETANAIARALLREAALFQEVTKKNPSNSETGGDLWYRFTGKAAMSEAYQYVAVRLP